MFAERGELFRDTSAKEATLRVDKAAMRDVVAGQVAALAQLDLASIEQLPPVTEVVSSLNNATVTQYHALMSEGRHMVVVQAFRRRGLGMFSEIEVDGFVLESDGTKRPLAEPEKWDFT